jgi:hypothetical protein
METVAAGSARVEVHRLIEVNRELPGVSNHIAEKTKWYHVVLMQKWHDTPR